MFTELNNMLGRLSGLREEIKRMQSPPSDVQKATGQSKSDFSEVLAQKKPGPAKVTEIDSTIKRLSETEGVDEELVRAVIDAESDFNPDAISEDGARGLMQLMPDTAAELGVNPDDPKENLKGGVQYLGQMLDEFGSLEEAVAAYNAGPEAVEDHGGVPPFRETQDYVKQVLDKYRNLKQEG